MDGAPLNPIPFKRDNKLCNRRLIRPEQSSKFGLEGYMKK